MSNYVSSDPRTDPRFAGALIRYHTWPTLRKQSNAEHMWNVARILLAVFPEVSRSLLDRALFHDIGEIRTGDLPYPIKADNPVLKSEVNRLEAEQLAFYHEVWGVPNLTASAGYGPGLWLLKMCDMIEMMEFATEECNLGNMYAAIIVNRVGDWLAEKMFELRKTKDPFLQDRYPGIRDYLKLRFPHKRDLIK